MSRHRLHIVIMGLSPIIYEGLHTILSQSEIDCLIHRINSLDDFEIVLHSKKVDVLITNPLLLINREKEVRKIRKNYPIFSIVGVNLGFTDNLSPSLFDTSFSIFDTTEQIVSKLQKAGNENAQRVSSSDDNLTERELDVLIQLVHGYPNKEIADSLNISVHTVATHRKNITVKTGIRSQAGLAIYAISKRIISIEDIDLSNH